MTYAVSAALQAAVYQLLFTDPEVWDLIEGAVYDALPSGTLPQTYVVLGPEVVRDRSDKTGNGADHDFTVSVVTEAAGFAGAKAVAGAVADALVDADIPLTRGRLVSMNFSRAVAARVGTGDQRRIDLTFRARVEDN